MIFCVTHFQFYLDYLRYRNQCLGLHKSCSHFWLIREVYLYNSCMNNCFVYTIDMRYLDILGLRSELSSNIRFIMLRIKVIQYINAYICMKSCQKYQILILGKNLSRDLRLYLCKILRKILNLGMKD